MPALPIQKDPQSLQFHSRVVIGHNDASGGLGARLALSILPKSGRLIEPTLKGDIVVSNHPSQPLTAVAVTPKVSARRCLPFARTLVDFLVESGVTELVVVCGSRVGGSGTGDAVLSATLPVELRDSHALAKTLKELDTSASIGDGFVVALARVVEFEPRLKAVFVVVPSKQSTVPDPDNAKKLGAAVKEHLGVDVDVALALGHELSTEDEDEGQNIEDVFGQKGFRAFDPRRDRDVMLYT
ncbi:hypothetical protein BJ742DRAFT_776726 [Cladochytrium replicatum]|nr:hypothetical protein BJ742DRAFT_776726 [Cladochytrium replicatum]